MARPQKCRRVCSPPRCNRFGPRACFGQSPITLAIDEYEALRLIDFEGLTQQQCAQQMAVARTTAQAIYACARQKVAACLVTGAELIIEGGAVVFSSHQDPHPCGKSCCHRRNQPIAAPIEKNSK